MLQAAQAGGLAEADPTFDVDGIDAAHKLTLLIQLAFGTRARFEDIRSKASATSAQSTSTSRASSAT